MDENKKIEKNKKREERKISVITLIILLLGCIIFGIIIGAFTPIIDIFDNFFRNKEIQVENNDVKKNNLNIKTEKLDDSELIYITNNNNETIYGINLYAMFYDKNDKPIDTQIDDIFFIEPGETVVSNIKCYDEYGKIADFNECVIDVQLDQQYQVIKDTFQPLESEYENIEKITISDINKVYDEFAPFVTYNITNNSKNKCANIWTVVVYYKNGKAIHAQEESLSAINVGKTKEVISMFAPKEYDNVKIFVKEAYKYSYQ